MKTVVLIFFITVSLQSIAQLCNGSLGDPIVNIAFSKTDGDLRYGETDFVPGSGCPKGGEYGITGLSFGCGDNRSWLAVAGDHTGDLGGRYMLINAEAPADYTPPSLIHRDTARGLCNNVRYVYSAWITNTLRSFSCNSRAIRANIFFKVTTLSGVLIDSIETGPLPVEEDKHWKQYGLSFFPPAGESAVIVSVYAKRLYGCGQGFAIDDITLQPCGPPIIATVNGSSEPLKVCADNTKPFIFNGAYAAGFASPSVQWQNSLDSGKTWMDIPSATSVDYEVPQQDTGVIFYRMAVAEGANIRSPNCRFYSNVLSTTVHPLPPHQVPQNLLGCLNKDFLLPSANAFSDSHLWTGPNGYSSTADKAIVPSVSNANIGLYQLHQDFGYGCIDVDSFYMNVYPSTTITAQTEYNICEGKGVTLSASGDGTFLWQPATGLSNATVASPLASPHDSTQYKVVVTNSFGCKDSALVKVNVFRNPEVNAGIDRTMVLGDTVVLNGFVKGTAIEFSWSPSLYLSDATVPNPGVSPPTDQQYTLAAQSTVGCGSAEDAVMVKVYNDIYVPNAFTPDNNGRNDKFKIVAADGYQLLTFRIYNRWGQIVYDAKDTGSGWDGKYNKLPQPEGTYVYYLEIRSSKGKLISKKGTVTLIR